MPYGDPNPYLGSASDETAELIALYAAEMGIPEERFGVIDGELYFIDDNRQYQRVDPSIALTASQPLGSVFSGAAGGQPNAMQLFG
ncbi:MAG: hypothetical protein ACR2RE_05175, partial [Geminicoccaceae bacterium]